MSSIKIDRLADEVMKGLNEYAEVTTDNVKKAVRKAASTVRREIQTNAPKKSGDYAKSWTAKKVRESSHTLEMVVHSRNKYQLAHLLEFGHCLRQGGRTKAIPHIAPAEELGIKQLEAEIERSIKCG